MLLPLPSANPDAVPEVSAAVQENEEPGVALVRAIPVVPPEQMAWAAGVADTSGIGFTVITTVSAAPVHPLAEGMMV